jgi:hypothetical protein
MPATTTGPSFSIRIDKFFLKGTAHRSRAEAQEMGLSVRGVTTKVYSRETSSTGD